jgi:hypothetical protein
MPDQSPEIRVLEMLHIKAALAASINEIDNINKALLRLASF